MDGYIALTRTRAKQLDLKYFIKWRDQEAEEVSLEKYLDVAGGVTGVGDREVVPKMFMCPSVQGWISGEDEKKLV